MPISGTNSGSTLLDLKRCSARSASRVAHSPSTRDNSGASKGDKLASARPEARLRDAEPGRWRQPPGRSRRRRSRRPRTTRRYDRARYNLDRHPTYALAGLIS
jgi:hypothetical protein